MMSLDAAIRPLLDAHAVEVVTVSLTWRRHERTATDVPGQRTDGYTVQIHQYTDAARPDAAHLGVVEGGSHAYGSGGTLDEAVADALAKAAAHRRKEAT